MKLWIARNESGDLRLYERKPKKIGNVWWCVNYDFNSKQLPTDLFPEVKWEDDEPTEVELKIVKKWTSHIVLTAKN